MANGTYKVCQDCVEGKPIKEWNHIAPSGILVTTYSHNPPYQDTFMDSNPVIFLARSYNLWRQNYVKSVKTLLKARKEARA